MCKAIVFEYKENALDKSATIKDKESIFCIGGGYNFVLPKAS